MSPPFKKDSMMGGPAKEQSRKIPMDLSTSPTQVDLSGSNRSTGITAGTLPTRPPLTLDDFEDGENLNMEARDAEKCEENERPMDGESARRSSATHASLNGSLIWERIHEEKLRQDRIRVSLSRIKGDLQ